MTIAGARTVVPRSGKIKKRLRMGDGNMSGFVLKIREEIPPHSLFLSLYFRKLAIITSFSVSLKCM